MVSTIDNLIGLGLLRQPRTVLFGPGQRTMLPRIVAPLGSHVLICTDERMATTAEYRALQSSLEAAGIDVHLFDRVQPDLPRGDIMTLQADLAGHRIDVVIGLGGGSCLDMAKVASLVLAHGGDVRDYFGENLVPGPVLPIITVPTTAGTGAEVSCIGVVYDEERGVKVGVASAHLEPSVAIVDPELTLSCPPGLTAATAADALSHLVESFTDRAKNPSPEDLDAHLYVGKNVLTDIYCRAGIRLLAGAIERVVDDPSDLGARSDMMLGAFCGGMALNTAGTSIAHAIQSPIGGLTHTSHGMGVGALLPYVTRYNLPVRVEVFAELAEDLGVYDPVAGALENAKAAITRLDGLLDALGVPRDLKALGLSAEQIDDVAERSLLSTRLIANNARPLTKFDAVQILERAYDGDRGWWSL